jgi:hypothetical protein
MFKYIAELISLYSLGFFFLTKNYRFLYSSLGCFNIPLLSRFLSILTINNNNSFKQGKFTTCYALYLIILIIINSKISS